VFTYLPGWLELLLGYLIAAYAAKAMETGLRYLRPGASAICTSIAIGHGTALAAQLPMVGRQEKPCYYLHPSPAPLLPAPPDSGVKSLDKLWMPPEYLSFRRKNLAVCRDLARKWLK
jgi:hypothetical protein